AVAHPQTNGQVERANGMILQGLKPRIFNKLNKFGRRWLTELPSVIWSLRTTPSRAMGFTPFFLVYGAEAMLPHGPGVWVTEAQGLSRAADPASLRGLAGSSGRDSRRGAPTLHVLSAIPAKISS